MMVFFFFSSRRRHTRCALVTGVQTCALPISKETKGEFNGRAMTYYGRWSYKYEEAARQGAAAVLIVHDTEPAAYGWNVVESSNTGTQYLADSKNGGAEQTEIGRAHV